MPMDLIALPLDEPKTSETEVAEKNLMKMLQSLAGMKASLEPYDIDSSRSHLDGVSITLVSLSNRNNLNKDEVEKIAAHIAEKYNPITQPEIYIIAPLANVNPSNFTPAARFQDALATALNVQGFNAIHKLTLPKNLSSKPEYKTEKGQFTITSTQNTNEVVLNNLSNYTEQMKSPETTISEPYTMPLLGNGPEGNLGIIKWFSECFAWFRPLFDDNDLKEMKQSDEEMKSKLAGYEAFLEQKKSTMISAPRSLLQIIEEKTKRGKGYKLSPWEWLLAPLDSSKTEAERYSDVLDEDQEHLSKDDVLATLPGNKSVKYQEVLKERLKLQEPMLKRQEIKDKIVSKLDEYITSYQNSPKHKGKIAVVSALKEYVKDPSQAKWAEVAQATSSHQGWDTGFFQARVRKMHGLLKEVHEESIKPESSKPKP